MAHSQGGQRIQNYLARAFAGATRPELVLLDDYRGTTDALLSIKDRIRHDFIVLGCDLITDFPLGKLIERSRTSTAAMIALLTVPTMTTFGQQVKETSSEPKHRSSDEGGSLLIALDEKKRRILSLIHKDDIEDDALTIPMALLTRYPHCRMHANLIDMHCYFFRKDAIAGSAVSPAEEGLTSGATGGTASSGGAALAGGGHPCLLTRNKHLFSLREDLLPRVIRRQFGRLDYYRIESLVVGPSSPSGGGGEGASATARLGASSTAASAAAGSSGKGDDQERALATYCLRANTLSSFAESSKQLVRLMAAAPAPGGASRLVAPGAEVGAKTQIGTDSMIGEHGQVGEKSSVKRSVIGNYVQVGRNVKISNSIIMDYVQIEDNCKIEGCIIAFKGIVREKCHLKDCDVGYEHVVERETTAKGEILGGSHNMFMEEAAPLPSE